MGISEYLPIWSKLTDEEKRTLEQASMLRKVKKGTIIHSSNTDCVGLLLIKSGQLRSYIFSNEGREITLYRLFEYDICLFSASCMMRSIQFDMTIEAEKDTEMFVISPDEYKNLMDSSVQIANYTNEIMATRFSEVMWLIEQIMWKSIDKRLAGFLISESEIEQSRVLKMTHEKIANHMGTAREVVTRMLRYFQSEGLVALNRGTIEILDDKGLAQISE